MQGTPIHPLILHRLQLQQPRQEVQQQQEQVVTFLTAAHCLLEEALEEDQQGVASPHLVASLWAVLPREQVALQLEEQLQ